MAGPGSAAGRRSLVLARLALMLAAILLPVMAMEAALRLAGPFLPGNYDTGAYLTRHPRYGHYHPPNYSGWIKRDEYVVHVRTNAERQRGPAVPFQRTPGTYRILVLGDSFVEAVQVAEHERFLARLQEQLNAGGGPIRYELIDGGCGGWGAVQELLYLQEEGPRYQPDLVLLAFFVGNDVHNNSLELELEGNANAALKPYAERRPDGALTILEPDPPTPTLPERVGFFLRERSALYNVVESGVMQKLSLDDLWASVRDLDGQRELSIREAEVYATRLDSRWRVAWSLTDTLLGRIQAESTSQGARFGLMIVPTRAQVVPESWRQMTGSDEGKSRDFDPMLPNTMLAGITGRTSTPLLDLTPAFREVARQKAATPLYFARDQHWTAAGHDLAARQMADWLKSTGLIPG
ncbi:MAG: hypothetical protein AB7K36_21990 [Chloroflexota bacterium]